MIREVSGFLGGRGGDGTGKNEMKQRGFKEEEGNKQNVLSKSCTLGDSIVKLEAD